MIETVKIVKSSHPKGYATINKSDFDTAKHELFDKEAKPRGRKKKDDGQEE